MSLAAGICRLLPGSAPKVQAFMHIGFFFGFLFLNNIRSNMFHWSSNEGSATNMKREFSLESYGVKDLQFTQP